MYRGSRCISDFKNKHRIFYFIFKPYMHNIYRTKYLYIRKYFQIYFIDLDVFNLVTGELFKRFIRNGNNIILILQFGNKTFSLPTEYQITD